MMASCDLFSRHVSTRFLRQQFNHAESFFHEMLQELWRLSRSCASCMFVNWCLVPSESLHLSISSCKPIGWCLDSANNVERCCLVAHCHLHSSSRSGCENACEANVDGWDLATGWPPQQFKNESFCQKKRLQNDSHYHQTLLFGLPVRLVQRQT